MDNELYVSLKNLGIVTNQFDFSKMMGRSSSYFSSIKSQDRFIAPGTLLKLERNLNNQLKSVGISTRGQQIATVSNFVRTLIMDRIA